MYVSEYLEQWSNIRSYYVRPRTLESYQSVIRLHINPAIGRKKLRKLDSGHIRAMLARISASGKTRTAEFAYTVLKTALSEAVLMGYINKSPMTNVKKPVHSPQMRAYLTHDQLHAYINAALADKYALAWMLALLCGLRRGEIVGLRWQDIDIQERVMHICNQRVQIGTQLLDTPPKSASGDRVIPIPDELLALLMQRKDRTGYLVPLTPNGLDTAHRRLCKTCGLPPVTPHGLRHTMASQAIAAGVHIKVLQTLLGHASFTTTANIYAHVDLRDQRYALANTASYMIY